MGGVSGIEDGISEKREQQLKRAQRQGDSEKHDDKCGTVGERGVTFQRKRTTGQTLSGNVL